MSTYVPQKGDFVTLTFDPLSGHGQSVRGPALVVSNDLFNKHTGICIACPITNTNRDSPFHVSIPAEENVAGMVMVEQVKSIDFYVRNVRRTGTAPTALLEEVLSILDTCLY
jgi:mRNA interferase MazF